MIKYLYVTKVINRNLSKKLYYRSRRHYGKTTFWHLAQESVRKIICIIFWDCNSLFKANLRLRASWWMCDNGSVCSCYFTFKLRGKTGEELLAYKITNGICWVLHPIPVLFNHGVRTCKCTLFSLILWENKDLVPELDARHKHVFFLIVMMIKSMILVLDSILLECVHAVCFLV